MQGQLQLNIMILSRTIDAVSVQANLENTCNTSGAEQI